MSDNTENKALNFTIWNAAPIFRMWAPLVFILTGMAGIYLLYPTNKETDVYVVLAKIIGGILLTATIVVPVFLILWVKNEIFFDGKIIMMKNVFRAKTININDIKKVDYDIHVYVGRGGGSWFELMLYPNDTPEGDYDYISLYSSADHNAFSDITKGDHSNIDLLLLYDDIIARYPEKKKEKEEESEAEYSEKTEDEESDII